MSLQDILDTINTEVTNAYNQGVTDGKSQNPGTLPTVQSVLDVLDPIIDLEEADLKTKLEAALGPILAPPVPTPAPDPTPTPDPIPIAGANVKKN